MRQSTYVQGRRKKTKDVLRERIYTPRIPVWFGLGLNLWAQHGRDLIALMRRFPGIFRNIPDEPPDITSAGMHEKTLETDNWGVVEEFVVGGIGGVFKDFPLADWKALETYVPPDDVVYARKGLRPDWDEFRLSCEQAEKEGGLGQYLIGELLFEQLWLLRGLEQLLIDLIEEPAQLPGLIEMVISRREALIARCLECGLQLFVFHDDLGMQHQLLMSPKTFRKWLKPGYARLWRPIKSAGNYVYMHSDGMIKEILPDLMEIGLDITNLQVEVNGIDDVAGICKGRICIKANLDDQKIIPYGTPGRIKEHVEEVVVKLGSPEGGLGLEAKLIGPAPMENLEALCSAAEEMRDHWK